MIELDYLPFSLFINHPDQITLSEDFHVFFSEREKKKKKLFSEKPQFFSTAVQLVPEIEIACLHTPAMAYNRTYWHSKREMIAQSKNVTVNLIEQQQGDVTLVRILVTRKDQSKK